MQLIRLPRQQQQPLGQFGAVTGEAGDGVIERGRDGNPLTHIALKLADLTVELRDQRLQILHRIGVVRCIAQTGHCRPELGNPVGRIVHPCKTLSLGCRSREPRTVRGNGARIAFDREREFDLWQALVREPAHRGFDSSELQDRNKGCDRGQGGDHNERRQQPRGNGAPPGTLRACDYCLVHGGHLSDSPFKRAAHRS